MKNELLSINNSKFLMNNSSSMYTAENTSNSKITNKKNRLNSKEETKYLISSKFDFHRRGQSFNIYKNPKTLKKSLYLTDMNTTYNEKEPNLRGTFELTSINHRIKQRQISNDSLPNIATYNKYIKNPQCFTCCNTKLSPKYLTKLYNDQQRKKDLDEIIDKKVKINTVRDDKNDYLRKTNDIKRIKYEINLKKEAIIEYKDNLKNHINSINYTISTIKSYKENLQTNFLNKYNENLRVLNGVLRDEKLKTDKQNLQLLNLKQDVAELQMAIRKKEAVLIKLKKWIHLQIYIKEGEKVKPENLKGFLEKKYNNQSIFESPEELEIIFTHKENKNLRLMNDYNKIIEEKKVYMKELNELKSHEGNIKLDMKNAISGKETTLMNLKKRRKELDNSLNELKSLKNTYFQINNIGYLNKRSKSVNNKIFYFENNPEGVILKNELGIYYKSTNIHNNIFVLIDCIYSIIIHNDINGLTFSPNYINEINNINISKPKKANIQMKIIEIGLNHLYSSIQEKINKDKNNLKIIQDTCYLIDLYHKRINGKKNKAEQEYKRGRLMDKIEEKNKKVYFLPRGKIEKYNMISIKKVKDKEKLKNKKVVKKIDIWDFLHDQNPDDFLKNQD